MPPRSRYVSSMHLIGRTLQLFGLIIVPMALIYYFQHQGQASESTLMFGELSILAIGAASFWVGSLFLNKTS